MDVILVKYGFVTWIIRYVNKELKGPSQSFNIAVHKVVGLAKDRSKKEWSNIKPAEAEGS